MTIFSNTEERWVENDILHGKMYFHVVDALAVAGGVVSTGAVDFEPHTVEDRELITGQNPSSDHLLGKKLVQTLEQQQLAR
jgi:putative intracellular protease/amidase